MPEKERKKSGMVSSVPQDNRPMTSSRPTGQDNPAYGDDVDIERTNVLLKNGTTVNIDDYDPTVHGKSVEESDDEYKSRMMSAPSGRPITAAAPRTTIGNLDTFDTTQAAAATPIPAPVPVVAAKPVGSPVATAATEESKKTLTSTIGKQSASHKE
jgi:hypothetical protein